MIEEKMWMNNMSDYLSTSNSSSNNVSMWQVNVHHTINNPLLRKPQ